MTGHEYIKVILDIMKEHPEAEFEAFSLEGLPVGTIRTGKVGRTTVKYEVIAIDSDPPTDEAG